MSAFSNAVRAGVKTAAITGAAEPDLIRHSAIPYELREQAFRDYVAEKAKEEPTGYLQAALSGAAAGAIPAALIGGLGAGAPGALGFGALGALGGGVGGALGAAVDKTRVQEARQAASDEAAMRRLLAERIAAHARAREYRQDWHASGRSRRYDPLFRDNV